MRPLISLIPGLPTTFAKLAKACALSLRLFVCKTAVLKGKGFGLCCRNPSRDAVTNQPGGLVGVTSLSLGVPVGD